MANLFLVLTWPSQKNLTLYSNVLVYENETPYRFWPHCGIIIKRIYIPTAPLLAVYIFFRDPSGCLAWYIQKYLLCPLSDKTVPIQFLGFIFISLGSGNVKFNIFLYHGSPKNNGNTQLLT